MPFCSISYPQGRTLRTLLITAWKGCMWHWSCRKKGKRMVMSMRTFCPRRSQPLVSGDRGLDEMTSQEPVHFYGSLKLIAQMWLRFLHLENQTLLKVKKNTVEAWLGFLYNRCSQESRWVGRGWQKDKLINIFKSASVHQALKKEWHTGENPNKGNICTKSNLLW